jgi:hypothetical protein
MAVQDDFDEQGLIVSAASRTLRQQLRALAWVTLEEVALDAVAEDGRLVARTSARHVAERLRIAPGSAAGALRILRHRGLLDLEREHGPAGRFGLSVYVLRPVAGLTVISPCAALPQVAAPSRVKPRLDAATVVVPQSGAPCVAGPDVAESCVDGPQPDHLPSQPSVQCPGQEVLDLGSVSS